jgi:hypothetical protein
LCIAKKAPFNQKDQKMKQSSNVLLACLLSINFASFAMDQGVPGPERPIQAFKRDIAALNNNDFKMIKRTLKGLNRSFQAFSRDSGISFSTCQGLIFTAAFQGLLEDPLKSLLEKYSLPIAQSADANIDFTPEEASCIHPIVLSLFSKKFQDLIQKRKTALIRQKLEDGEEIDKWEVLEKKAFGMGLLNTELKALKDEFLSIQAKISPFCIALQEVKAERRAQQRQNGGDELLGRLVMAMMMRDMLRGDNHGMGIHIIRQDRQEDDDNSPKPDTANKKK